MTKQTFSALPALPTAVEVLPLYCRTALKRKYACDDASASASKVGPEKIIAGFEAMEREGDGSAYDAVRI